MPYLATCLGYYEKDCDILNNEHTIQECNRKNDCKVNEKCIASKLVKYNSRA